MNIEDRTHFVYDRDNRATYAYKIYMVSPKRLSIAVGQTYCSPKDNFCKETGRRYAENRLNAGLAILQNGGDPHNIDGLRFRLLELFQEDFNFDGPVPTTCKEWRELEEIIMDLTHDLIPEPAAWFENRF